MKTKRSQEGYLLVDHRNSPGLADDRFRAMDPDAPVGAGRKTWEAPTLLCSHCQAAAILNPLRQRERGYCSKCDHYICDQCAITMRVTGVHRSFAQVIDDVQERAGKGLAVPIFDRNPTTWPSALSLSPPST
jgi:hypothetical protein